MVFLIIGNIKGVCLELFFGFGFFGVGVVDFFGFGVYLVELNGPPPPHSVRPAPFRCRLSDFGFFVLLFLFGGFLLFLIYFLFAVAVYLHILFVLLGLLFVLNNNIYI